jgi:predicted outer membrane repeat protein
MPKKARAVVKYVSSTQGDDAFTGDHRVNVPPGTGPYATIQHGVDELAGLQVRAGHKTLIVLMGEYKENVEMDGAKYSDITVTGDAGGGSEIPGPDDFCAARPLVDGQKRGSVFYITGATGVTLSELSIQNGKSRYGGGVKAVRCQLDIIECCIQHNEATNAGGGFNLDHCKSSHVQNCQILSNQASSQYLQRRGGGGGRVTKSWDVGIVDSVFAGNSAPRTWGGGLCIDAKSSQITVGGCSFSDSGAVAPNFARFGGGIAVLDCAQITLIQNDVALNEASEDGGGIMIGASDKVRVLGNDVDSNSANGSGGGIMMDSCLQVSLTGNDLEGNEAKTDSGGGIYLTGVGDSAFQGNHIGGNVAFKDGGGMKVYACDKITLQSDRIASNSAQGSGGGIAMEAPTLSIHETRISSNSAGSKGGGICAVPYGTIWRAGYLVMDTGSILRYNEAGMEGGGLYTEVQIDVRTCTVSRNQAGTSGGGFRIKASPAIIDQCNFLRNVATDDGGAVSGVGQAGITIGIWNSTVTRNTAGGKGGGLEFDQNGLLVQGTAFDGNKADSGGGASLNNVGQGNVSLNQFMSNQSANGSGVDADQCVFGPTDLRFQGNGFSNAAGGGADVLLEDCAPNTLKPADIANANNPGGGPPPKVVIR